jgi:dihydroflavonol-4-reductase
LKRDPPASRTLVTGATGFLGTHLLERLTADPKQPLRVLVRSAVPELAERGVEVTEGSILDESAVERAVEGVSRIYHLAGRVSRNPDDGPELYRVHVQGTSILCRAAKRHGVERVVVASTSGTIAVTGDGKTVPDETHPIPLGLIGKWPYYTSKLYQEEAAKRELSGGPELVIVNPSLLLGPGDRKLSSTEDVMKFLASEIPAVPPGGINFVDARDAAQALESAMVRGRPFERYLVGGPNWTFETFFQKLSRLSGVKAPWLKLPGKLYSFTGKAMDALYQSWELAPPVDRVSVEMSEKFWYVDSSKAERELGFVARDPCETLYDTVAYIKKEFLSQAVL